MGRHVKRKGNDALLDKEFEIFMRKMFELHPDLKNEKEKVQNLMHSSFLYGAGIGMQITLDYYRKDAQKKKDEDE